MRRDRRAPGDEELAAWCRDRLRAEPEAALFRAGYLSTVTGLRLTDGREVVVKTRPPAPRLCGCLAVQAALAAAGFPCPRPLAGPAPLGRLAATAEQLVPGGGPQLDRLADEVGERASRAGLEVAGGA